MNDQPPLQVPSRTNLRPALRPIVLLNLLLILGGLYAGFALSQWSGVRDAIDQVGTLGAPDRVQGVITQVEQEISTANSRSLPSKYRYEGLLYKNDGKLMNTTINITINIYGEVFDGTSLWNDTFNNVKVREGRFDLILGSQKELGNALDNSPRYIGVSLNGALEIIPRERVYPVPWALHSVTARDVNITNSATRATQASSASSAVTATETQYLNQQGHTRFTLASHYQTGPTSILLTTWVNNPNGTMCLLGDMFTPLDAGVLQLDCRIDGPTKTLHAGPHSYCAAECFEFDN